VEEGRERDSLRAERERVGHVAALVRSRMNSLIPFERTKEQTTETMHLALKQ